MINNAKGNFVILYEKYKTPVYFMALSILKDKTNAEDIMQEVFLRVYKSIEKNESIMNFKAWVLKVTRNLSLNYIRDNKQVFEEDVNEMAYVGFEDVLIEGMSSYKILQCISSDERMIFTLHYIDGYKLREIANILEIPMGTVQTKCHVAKKKLVQEIKNLS